MNSKEEYVNWETMYHLNNEKSYKCECGCEQVKHENEYHDEICGVPSFVEGEIVCMECGKSLDYFSYGKYESDEED